MSLSAPTDPKTPRHRVVVLPWLRHVGDRLIVPDWLATTVGPLIVAWRPLSKVELAHELAHVRQWRRHGLLFIARYLLASWRAARSGGDRYRDNIFEIEARRAAGQAAARARAEISPCRAGPSRHP